MIQFIIIIMSPILSILLSLLGYVISVFDFAGLFCKAYFVVKTIQGFSIINFIIRLHVRVYKDISVFFFFLSLIIFTVFDGIYDLRLYITHPNFSRANQGKKQSINIKRDEINMIHIINDNTFNLHNRPLINDNKHLKVTLKSKLIGVSR